jgi:hypothetical protein
MNGRISLKSYNLVYADHSSADVIRSLYLADGIAQDRAH